MARKTQPRKSAHRKTAKRGQASFVRSLAKNHLLITIGLLLILAVSTLYINQTHRDLAGFRAQPFNRVYPQARPSIRPAGVTPTNVRSAYNLTGGGSGTIAIIDAYDDPKIESDLAVFSQQYGLRACTTANGCFEKRKMASVVPVSSDWSIEMALDVEWAHAVAPNAKILLVESRSNSGTDLMAAVDYARSRPDVVSISMSWGGDEFTLESSYESRFVSPYGASFFASSGDNGHGVSWPAASANVISVGGTSVALNAQGVLTSETAWSGSGGGISAFIRTPAYQSSFAPLRANTRRSVPDVSFNADPNSGFPVYNTVPYGRSTGWFIVGGTSAGAPQWAAMRSISAGITNTNIYKDAASSYGTYFRDIVSGTNGRCGIQCTAQVGYDYVTGLGSPLSPNF